MTPMSNIGSRFLGCSTTSAVFLATTLAAFLAISLSYRNYTPVLRYAAIVKLADQNQCLFLLHGQHVIGGSLGLGVLLKHLPQKIRHRRHQGVIVVIERRVVVDQNGVDDIGIQLV